MRLMLGIQVWLAVVSGCAPGLELAVDVRTDLVPGVEFDLVDVELDGVPGAVRPSIADDEFRRGARAAEFRGLSQGRHQVRVRLLRGNAAVLTRRVALRLEGSMILPVVLTRDCRGVMCPGTGSVTDTECLGGACVDPGCSSLDPDACPAAECRTDAECASETACVAPGCVEGVCLETARDGACGAGQVCVPGEGCVDEPGSGSADAAVGGRDAGPGDGGPVDAGPEDGGSADAGLVDGGIAAPVPPSCATPGPGRSDCGPLGTGDCCESPLVTGGTFDRSYDAVTYTDMAFSATVSDFRLDRYEITVGRFRQFVAAVEAGWRPTAGAGRHTHLNGGMGLSNSGVAGGFEPGWDAAWTAGLPTTEAAWTTALSCDATYQTWTSAAGLVEVENESRAINCLDWFAAQAFCLWDGGFLPSEAEWNYAASGGSEQRVYPWSSPPTSTSIDATRAMYGLGPAGSVTFVGSQPAGDGRYGQSDLGGNVFEWALDVHVSPYAAGTCANCSQLLPDGSSRVLRGGDFFYPAPSLLASSRDIHYAPSSRFYGIGARCARTP